MTTKLRIADDLLMTLLIVSSTSTSESKYMLQPQDALRQATYLIFALSLPYALASDPEELLSCHPESQEASHFQDGHMANLWSRAQLIEQSLRGHYGRPHTNAP